MQNILKVILGSELLNIRFTCDWCKKTSEVLTPFDKATFVPTGWKTVSVIMKPRLNTKAFNLSKTQDLCPSCLEKHEIRETFS